VTARPCLDCGRPARATRCRECAARLRADSPYQTREWRRFARARKGRACERCGSTYRLTLHHVDGRQPEGITAGRFATLCIHCHSELHGSS
jgi:hypothetical protein